MAAIVEALKQNPTLANETISVVFSPFEDLERMQQMFSDLNRTVKVTSKSLNILYDHRDLLSQLVLDAVNKKVSFFRELVDKDRVSLPLRSPKLFTLSAVYDASKELVGVVTSENQDEKADIINNYWETVGENIRQWKQVQRGELRPSELRAEYVNSHAVVLWGIGVMGRSLIQEYPTDWQSQLTRLSDIDWRRTNKEWQGVCMQGTDIVNRRQSRIDTATFLKYKMGGSTEQKVPVEVLNRRGRSLRIIMIHQKKCFISYANLSCDRYWFGLQKNYIENKDFDYFIFLCGDNSLGNIFIVSFKTIKDLISKGNVDSTRKHHVVIFPQRNNIMKTMGNDEELPMNKFSLSGENLKSELEKILT